MKKQRTWQDILFFLYKIVVVVLLIALAAMMLRMQTTRDIEITELETSMSSLFSSLEKGDANTLKRLYGLEGGAYDGWFLYTAESMMDVTEVLVVKVSDESQMEDVEAAVNERLSQQKTSFQGYGTNQTALLNHAAQVSRGDYYFFAVSEEIDAWEEAFLACVT